jgi:glycosyltransferase involved in cell wall biosynthesis
LEDRPAFPIWKLGNLKLELMSRTLIVTDAWHPLVNGVVRTLDTTTRTLRELGHVVEVLEPSAFAQVAVPFYPEIRVCFPWPHRVFDRIRKFEPDHVHISTEGPLGMLARRFCVSRGWRFSTSYHTRFPEYLHTLARVPERFTYRFLRWFHNGGSSLMVATPSLEAELTARGFTAPIRRWSRGVDQTAFRPRPRADLGFPRPVLLYVGRVSAEKGIDDFLKLDTPGTKVVVGDGPARADLERRYPAAKFLGYRKGESLGECYAAADLFVFPSRTDTFGLVVIEALASGLPVAAFPATGPIDILTRPEFGATHADLGEAIRLALAHGDRAACLAEGASYTWARCTGQFLGNLVPARPANELPTNAAE